MRYEAVLFDLFGTLVPGFSNELYLENLAELSSILEMDRESFTRRWVEDSRNRARGMYRDIPHVISVYTGYDDDDPRVLKAAMSRLELTRRSLEPKEEAVETLNTLKEMGVKVGLVTNCAQDVPVLFPGNPMFPYFDTLAYSSVLKAVKPDERIYLAALEPLGVKRERVVFVGDGDSDELTGAARLGMTPVQVVGGDLEGAFTLSKERDSAERKIRDLREILEFFRM